MFNQLNNFLEQLRQQEIVYYPVLFFSILVAALLVFQGLCLNKTFKAFADKKIRLIFLKRVYFFGSYSENVMAMKKYATYENIMPIYVADTNVKFTAIVPEGIDFETARVILKEQKRQYNRGMRKQHKAELWYVNDNFVTRYFGWTPNAIALQLLDVDRGKILRMKGQFKRRMQEANAKKVAK